MFDLVDYLLIIPVTLYGIEISIESIPLPKVIIFLVNS